MPDETMTAPPEPDEVAHGEHNAREVTCEPVEPPGDLARVLPLGSLAELWAAEAEEARAAAVAGVPRGPVTGFPAIDRELGGYLAPGLHFLHGEPGTGKTNLALQVAANCGTPALFVSCEMGPLEIARRIVARVTDTFLGKLKDGTKSSAEMLDLFARAVDACPALALLDATRAYAPMPEILAAAAAWRDRHGARQVLVVIDSLHTWSATAAAACGQPTSEYEALNLSLRELGELAAELAAPVLCVAERPRHSMKDAGQSAAKGSARIEYSAESVVSLNRETDNTGAWASDARGERQLYAKLSKNRHGDTGRRIDIRFNGATATLREV